MIIKKSLKITLSALLLATGVSAYAEGPVTLGDNKTQIAWSEFVSALNNPDGVKVTGDITTLPASNQAKKDYDTANKNLSAAQTVLGEKKAAVETAKTAKEEADKNIPTADQLSAAEKQLSEAKAALQDIIDAAQGKLDDANDELKTKQGDLETLNTTLSGYKADLITAKRNLADAEKEVRTYTAQLATLPKKTETTTETVGWLQTIYEYANTFETNYGNMVDSPNIYINKVTTTSWGGSTTKLTISFSGTKPDVDGDWESVTPSQYYTKILAEGTSSVNTVAVYLGPKYAEKNSGNANLSVGNYQGNKEYILSLAVEAVGTLTGNAKFQETTTTVLDEYQDKTAAQNIQDQIDAAEDNVKMYTKEIKGVHPDKETGKLPEGETKEVNGLEDNITLTETSITNTTNAINTLENTTIPNLKQEVKDAESNEKANKDIKDAQDALDALTGAQSAAQTAAQNLADAEAAVTEADSKVQTAQAAVDEAKAQAQAEADEIAKTKYLGYLQNITLTGDVVVTEQIKGTYSGTISGGGNIITNNSSSSIFSIFTGYLSNVAINGTFASGTAGATFSNVAYWPNKGQSNGSGKFYESDGALTDKIQTLGELGFAARDFFGVDFTAKELAKIADNTIVYSITTYSPTAEPVPNYVTLDGTQFVGASSNLTLEPNMFAESATADLMEKALPNVFYGNTCPNVVITDKAQFYCPVQLTAEKLTYNRQMNKGQNTICLPFELKASYNSNIEWITTFDKENKDTNQFWFKKVGEGVVPANTPVLLVAKAAFNFNASNMENIIIGRTENQKIEDEGDSTDPCKSYGLLKSCNPEEFKEGVTGAYKMYGLKGDKFYAATETGTNFPAFRTVIYCPTATEANQAPRRVRFCDEFGNDITGEIETAINGVEADAAQSVKVVGGQGAITITAEADYGQVAVYALDGKMVAKANVTEGTTTVNVKGGVYIVLGQKVLVK